MKKTIGSIVKHIVLLVLAVIWLVPIIWLVVTSFSGYKGINTAHFFPTSWSMDNFVQLLTRPDSVVQYVSWFKNTLIIAVFTCIISTIFVIMVSYAMSCMRFNGRKQIMSASLILNMFPGPLLMIAIYFILKMLGLTNSHFGMIIVYSAGSGLGFLIMKGFMDTIPMSLKEAARLEGASEAKIFMKVILPLCKPVIAALAIMTAVGHWNSWFDVYIYNPSGRFDTLQMYLRKILLDSEAASKLMNDQKKYEAMKNLTTSSVRAATTMIVTIPIVCVYPFFQKYFVSGITIGAVKG